MLTKNWYKMMGAYAFGKISVNVTNYSGNSIGFTGNADYFTFDVASTGPKLTNYTGTKYGGVTFGTGTTQPSEEDIDLSGSAIQNLTCSSIKSVTADDDGIVETNVFTITNSNSEAVTIGEVGAFCGNGSYYGCLCDRTVLDEPVTIPAGGVGRVTYTIRMEYPTA